MQPIPSRQTELIRDIQNALEFAREGNTAFAIQVLMDLQEQNPGNSLTERVITHVIQGQFNIQFEEIIGSQVPPPLQQAQMPQPLNPALVPLLPQQAAIPPKPIPAPPQQQPQKVMPPMRFSTVSAPLPPIPPQLTPAPPLPQPAKMMPPMSFAKGTPANPAAAKPVAPLPSREIDPEVLPPPPSVAPPSQAILKPQSTPPPPAAGPIKIILKRSLPPETPPSSKQILNKNEVVELENVSKKKRSNKIAPKTTEPYTIGFNPEIEDYWRQELQELENSHKLKMKGLNKKLKEVRELITQKTGHAPRGTPGRKKHEILARSQLLGSPAASQTAIKNDDEINAAVEFIFELSSLICFATYQKGEPAEVEKQLKALQSKPLSEEAHSALKAVESLIKRKHSFRSDLTQDVKTEEHYMKKYRERIDDHAKQFAFQADRLKELEEDLKLA